MKNCAWDLLLYRGTLFDIVHTVSGRFTPGNKRKALSISTAMAERYLNTGHSGAVKI